MSHVRPALRLDISDRGAAFVLMLVAAVALAACGPGATGSTPGDALRVVTTTTVLADLVEQVGGDRVSVVSLVPKGGEVHTFDPTPSDLQAVTAADLIVLNGLGLDEWLADMVTDSGATAPMVELGEDLEGVTYLAGQAHADGDDATDGSASDAHDHEGEAVNPHLWLDVAHAMRYVERIVATLCEADPEHAADYRSDGDAFLARLAELDATTRDRIASIPEADRVIVSFHEAFPYFAAAYGLTVVGTIVDAPGQDPSAGEIADLVEAIRASGAKAVFGEAQFSPDLAEIVADEAGVAVETHLYSDSLGDAPADTYEGMIRWDVDRVVTALGG
jgi:manganese/iron transport system substrate-binding protein